MMNTTQLLEQLIAWLHTTPAWLVGGAVRDMAMHHVPSDIDIAVAGNGFTLARACAKHMGATFVPLDEQHGCGRMVVDDHTIDISSLRAPTIAEDLALRDVTINALAVPLAALHHQPLPLPPAIFTAHVIDPLHGVDDIAAHTLRLCYPAAMRDDPLRVLRAIRFAARYRFTISDTLDSVIREHSALLPTCAGERIRDELLKIFAVPNATTWLRYLDNIGALTLLIPELEPARTCEQPHFHFLPVLGHLFETVASIEWLLACIQRVPSPVLVSPPVAVQTHPNVHCTIAHADKLAAHVAAPMPNGYPRYVLLKIAALLHDVAKPYTKHPKPDGSVSFYGHQEVGAEMAFAIAHRLRLSRNDSTYIATVVREHMRPGQLRELETLTPRAIVRFFHDSDDTTPDVLLLSLADHLAACGNTITPADWHANVVWCGSMLDAYWRIPETPRQPLLNGYDVMQRYGIAPGTLVGTLLAEVREAHAAGEITTRDEAFALVETFLQQR